MSWLTDLGKKISNALQNAGAYLYSGLDVYITPEPTTVPASSGGSGSHHTNPSPSNPNNQNLYENSYEVEETPDEFATGKPGQKLNTKYSYGLSSSNSGALSFNFLYNSIPDKNVVREVASTNLGIYATKLGTSNPYYTYGQNTNAIYISNGLTVPNCVGYAHGRVREIWGRCKEAGYIK